MKSTGSTYGSTFSTKRRVQTHAAAENGRGPFSTRSVGRLRLRGSGVTAPSDGHFGRRSRLAEYLLVSEGVPLAAELYVMHALLCEVICFNIQGAVL